MTHHIVIERTAKKKGAKVTLTERTEQKSEGNFGGKEQQNSEGNFGGKDQKREKEGNLKGTELSSGEKGTLVEKWRKNLRKFLSNN